MHHVHREEASPMSRSMCREWEAAIADMECPSIVLTGTPDPRGLVALVRHRLVRLMSG